jgi:hypothetical protein
MTAATTRRESIRDRKCLFLMCVSLNACPAVLSAVALREGGSFIRRWELVEGSPGFKFKNRVRTRVRSRVRFNRLPVFAHTQYPELRRGRPITDLSAVALAKEDHRLPITCLSPKTDHRSPITSHPPLHSIYGRSAAILKLTRDSMAYSSCKNLKTFFCGITLANFFA